MPGFLATYPATDAGVSCIDRRSMITQENFLRLRTHRNNIQRYRELLETSLTVFERQYIERQLSEEQLAIETLAAEILGPANTPLSGFPRQAGQQQVD